LPRRVPEEDVAAALEAAAAAARARGAPETAAALAEQAVRLTPEDCTEDIQRRRIHAAEHLVQCGDLARARGLVEQAIAALEPGPLRARGLLSLGLIQAHELGRWEDSFATDEQALREVGDDHRLRAEVERQVAWSYLTSYRASEAEPHAQAALELAERLGDRVLLAEALAAAASLEFQRGRGFRQDLVDRALALETRYEHPRVFRHPNWPLYTLRHWSGDLAGARACIEALMGLALERGEENAPPWLLGKLAAIEYAAGNWSGALSHADAAFAAAVRTGQEEPRLGALEARAWVEASAGSVEPARRKAQELLRRDDESTVICGRCLLGFIELSVGDAVSAASSLKPLLRDARRHGVEDPSVFPFWPDAIEAFISSGELGEAEPVLEWLEERGRTLDRPWALATAGRCRGLLSAAEGDLEGALAAFESALVQHERVPIPFERGRTLLAYGATQRRAKQKSLARATLSEARVVFDELGARLWTEQARAELARIGGRAPGSEELTPTERRVAELVGEGHSNKEVAAALYVGVRTVEAHLTHVYAKLGVRSRGQLARKLTRDT
jgi:DNA-binding CsgD family transcriptional regulator